MKPDAVLLNAFAHRRADVPAPGLSSYMLAMAEATAPALREAGVAVHLAATAGESSPGLWDRVRAAWPASQRHLLANEHQALQEQVHRLLGAHARLVVHCQAMHEIHSLRPLQRAHPGRLRLHLTLHAYRNHLWYGHCWARGADLWLHHAGVEVSLPASSSRPRFPRLDRAGRLRCIPLPLSAAPEASLPAELATELDQPGLLHLVCPGDFRSGKAQLPLLRALAPLLREDPRLRLHFPCRGSRAAETALMGIAAPLGLGDQVRVVPTLSRPQLSTFFRRCQLGLFPSRCETFGLALGEALLAGLPLLATATGLAADLPELATQDRLLPARIGPSWTARVRTALAQPQTPAQTQALRAQTQHHCDPQRIGRLSAAWLLQEA